MSDKKTVLSGVQPSGRPTLGNYLGAFVNFAKIQQTHDALYCVVDMHAITVRQEPEKLRQQTFDLAAWYLASGLNPEKCTLFIQSHVPEHAMLGWILGTFTQMGELERMTQFKDKAARHKHNINAGLFTYPALMAADILLYQTDEVPVGHDQTQHLELTRNIAHRFNEIYGPVFTMPKAVIPKAAARVKDLQEPTAKMSKSVESGGTIFLDDDLKTIEKKIKRAVTDTVGAVNWDEENQPGVANLIGIYAACADKSLEAATAEFAGGQYGPLKKAVAEAVVTRLEPVKQKHAELVADEGELSRIFAAGAAKAQSRAAETLQQVMHKVGFITAA